MEFAGTNESVIDLINETENLIVLKTLSKAFGSAAMRLGFAISNRDLISGNSENQKSVQCQHDIADLRHNYFAS